MTKDMEYKNFQIKEISKDGVVQGYGSTFDSTPDSYGDIVAAGAFKKSLRERGNPKMLWQHNSAEPIGQWVDVKEGKNGLKVVGSLNLDTQRGKEAYSLYKRGDMNGLSIGFRIVNSDYNPKTDIRTIKEAKLYEVSLVTFPANENATVTSVKEELESEFAILNIKQKNKVLDYVKYLKSLDSVEPDDVKEDDNDDIEISDEVKEILANLIGKSPSEVGTDDDDSNHSSGDEADDKDSDELESKDNEPELDEDEVTTRLIEMTKILKGEL